MQQLDELKGQPVASRMLAVYLEKDPPPLMIFSGSEGTGRWSAAEAFIQQQLCEQGTACGVCPGCVKILRGNHPDFIQFPETRISIGNPKDPAEFSVRWLLQKKLPYSPFEARRRFILIPRADQMQHEAGTALLKSLEEPPSHTRFIFLVHRLEDLKETVLSRGVVIPFRNLSHQVLCNLTGIDFSPDQLQFLGGSVHMLPFLQTELAIKMQDQIQDGIKHPQALLELEKWLHSGEKTAFAEWTGEESFSYDEILEIFMVMLLSKIISHASSQELARAIFDFKAEQHHEVAGFLPFIMGRLFHRLNSILFNA